MANIDHEEIADAWAAIIEAADGQGVVITDKRFSQSNKDLARLLKSQANADEWRGWVFTFINIPQQFEAGGPRVDLTYRFFAKFYHFYHDDVGKNTDASFKRALFVANETLNKRINLGLGNQVTHQRLISQADFDVENIGGGTVDQLCHTAPFTFDVMVTGCYDQIR